MVGLARLLSELAAVVLALCLVGALAAFLVYPVYAQSDDRASAPSNLSASIAEGGVLLSWSAPAQDAASVTGYEILRRRSTEEEKTLLVLVADTRLTATVHVDTTANEPGVRYVYRVKRCGATRKAPGPTMPGSTCPTSPHRRRNARSKTPGPRVTPSKLRVTLKTRVEGTAMPQRRRRWRLRPYPSWSRPPPRTTSCCM